MAYDKVVDSSVLDAVVEYLIEKRNGIRIGLLCTAEGISCVT